MQTKKSRPVLAHQGGRKKNTIIILPLLRGAVKLAATAAGVYMAVALAALNWATLLAGTLVLNAALGMYFRLEGMQLDAARNPQQV